MNMMIIIIVMDIMVILNNNNIINNKVMKDIIKIKAIHIHHNKDYLKNNYHHNQIIIMPMLFQLEIIKININIITIKITITT